jgi:hypothetical protein
LAAGVLSVPALLLLLLASQAADEGRPPPQFSNSICIDEKLASMRLSPPEDPNLLVVGSSVAWRHFNSPEAIKAQPDLIPYNAGFCGANIKQTEEVVDWLTNRLPSVTDVLLIASPIDFQNCNLQQTGGLFPPGFNVTEADGFVFEDTSALPYYLRHFDPWTLWQNARGLKARRDDMATYATLMINGFGDGPIEPPDDRRLLYGAPLLDASCYDRLRETALSLQDQGIGFYVTIAPLHPEWQRLYDDTKQVTGTLDTEIRKALVGTEGHMIKTTQYIQRAGFFDGIHFRWSYTGPFTRSLLSQIETSAIGTSEGGSVAKF